MNILILRAGMSDPSNSATLAHAFAAGLQSSGAHVETLHLKDLHLDHFDAAIHYDHPDQCRDDFSTLAQAVTSADGIVIATPIWNFSVPAHLKNVIDRLGAIALDTETHSQGMLKGKPFFLIFSGGMPSPGWKGMLSLTTSHVQEAIRYFGGSTVGVHYEGRTTPARGKFGLVVDKRPASLLELEQKGRAFAEIIDRFVRTGSLPLKQAIAHRVLTFGYALVQKLVYTFS